YRPSRDDSASGPSPLTSTASTDAGRPERTYPYSLVAVDQAGNVSPAAVLRVRVDVTPPIVDILSPVAGAAVSGSVDVRGTAFSADDFKEYLLSVAAASGPTPWTLLKPSTSPPTP